MSQPLNTPPVVMVKQAAENLKRNLPIFIEQEAHREKICIVGGAPSLPDTLAQLRFAKERGAVILALNNAHDWLIEHGITPDMHCILDARVENARFVRNPRRTTLYLIAAQCHPAVFDALDGYQVIQWVADVPGMTELVVQIPKPIMLVGGGSTVGLKAMMLAYLWGFRWMALFGMDSCYRNDQHHAYKQDLNDNEAVFETTIEGRKFSCSKWMVAQAEDFQTDAKNLIEQGVTLKAYGDGLLQFILKHLQTEHAHAA